MIHLFMLVNRYRIVTVTVKQMITLAIEVV